MRNDRMAITHWGGGGGKGSCGSLISGILTRAGLGGSTMGLMPPFARGRAGTNGWGFIAFSATRGVLNITVGILLTALGLFSASSLSANPPCFSPLESFLTAYSTLICLPEKYCPFIWAMARSAEVKLSQLTNPWPLLAPSSVSLVILVLMTMPKLLKVSQSSFSSTSRSRLPTKILAPTSCVRLSWDALLTLMGLPQSLIMCMILMEQSASSSLLNSMKPYPWCQLVILSRGMCTFTTGPHCVKSSHSTFSFTFWSRLPQYTVASWFRSYSEGIAAILLQLCIRSIS